MKKIATSALLVLLCIMFVMGVYCYGTDQRYSLWRHFEQIVSSFVNVPSIYKVVDIWTKSVYYDNDPYTLEEVEKMYVNGEVDDNDYDHYYTHHNPDVGWENLYACTDGTCIFKIKEGEKHIIESYVGDDGLFKFFDSIRVFFLRVGLTVGLFVRVIVSVFSIIFALFPWNGLVEREEAVFVGG